MIEKLVIGLQRFFFGHRLLTLGVLLLWLWRRRKR